LPPWRYRAQVVDSTFGMVDAAGATPAEAEARVLSRWRRKWLGVEWVGAGTPEAAKGADCGEIAEQPRDSLGSLLEQNERFVMIIAQRAELVVCAWGAHGAHHDRGAAMLATLDRAGIACHGLALTRDGHPAHPLRLASSSEPRPIHQLLHELRLPDDQVGVERDIRGVIRRIERSAS